MEAASMPVVQGFGEETFQLFNNDHTLSLRNYWFFGMGYSNGIGGLRRPRKEGS